jgi:thiol-disulfide isomerase/thioredoxin
MIFMKKILAFAFLLFIHFQGFSQTFEGLWRVVLLSDGGEMPFQLEIIKNKNKNESVTGFLINAEEKIKLDNISLKGDNIVIPLHIFDASLLGKLVGSNMNGVFRKNYAPQNDLAFKAFHQNSNQTQQRFETASKPPQTDISGKWETTFTDKEGKSYPAVGIFKQKGNYVTGTFLTETGDYRYLEGILEENQLKLSTFDGNHAFLFKAKLLDNNTLEGEFWSGKTYNEKWKATRNDNAKLRDAYQITYLKEGFDKVDFKLLNLDSNWVSLSDKKYENKVVILQIFGTWCPNCMDETVFLSSWYQKHSKQPVSIIGLAFERKNEFGYAKKMIEKVIKRFDVKYDFLVAGTNDKAQASKVLPMLNGIYSFPTTIFIDKKGKVRKIHTGFSGKATGIYYTKFVEEFNDLMEKMLKE